jgi:hypothetical protein
MLAKRDNEFVEEMRGISILINEVEKNEKLLKYNFNNWLCKLPKKLYG